MKILSKIILITFSIILIFFLYLSFFGIETNKFNKQISDKLKNIDNNLEIELKKIKINLDIFKLKIKVKTIGPKIINKQKSLDIENIKIQISLKSFFQDQFLIENLELSTKPIEIKNAISFLRSFKNSTELYILEKIVKKGFLVADLKLNFDEKGNIKENFQIDGFVKDTRFGLLEKYEFKKLNFSFNLDNERLLLQDLALNLNNINLNSQRIIVSFVKNKYIVEGEINNKEILINQQDKNLFIQPYLNLYNIDKINLSSKNKFNFELDRKFKFNKLKVKTLLNINEASLLNKFDLKNIFPEIKDEISLIDHKIEIDYQKQNLSVKGKGDIISQKNKDTIEYSFNKKDDVLFFELFLKIKDNPIILEILNFKNNLNKETQIRSSGSYKFDKDFLIKEFSLKQKKNEIKIKDLRFNNKFQIEDLNEIIFNYKDSNNEINNLRLIKNNKNFILTGPFFNADNLINSLIDNEKKSEKKWIKKKVNLLIDVYRLKIDEKFKLKNFNGNLLIENFDIKKGNLIGNFSNNKQLKFTINYEDGKKITTLFVDEAETIVKRYKFVKGFEGGSLDLYSIKNGDISNTTIKIYEFKLKELPVLTKILTLASLQGIADILSGEGIGFDEFEMNFQNKKKLMTINEIYAIGPAISILMEGYVEKDNIISLRGTLVPATTINKVIGSIPILGKILVGSKTGEGVFGVSFKIKGQPKNLETKVNPIKTLTPRFITRTLEKIKKN